MSVVEADVVFAAFVAADNDAFLGETRVLLDVPDFENPVGIQRVDASTALVAHHVDDVVVLQGWLRAEVHTCQ